MTDIDDRDFAPTSRFEPPKMILLEKVVKDSAPRRLGDIVHWTYKSLPDHQALRRAIAALKREGEDPLHWKAIE